MDHNVFYLYLMHEKTNYILLHFECYNIMYNYNNIVGITVIFASPLSGYRFQVKLSYNFYFPSG